MVYSIGSGMVQKECGRMGFEYRKGRLWKGT